MIHYHGTPCGGKRTDAIDFLSGRHALVSWENPEDLAVVMDVCQSFCLDNGAFSRWTSKKPSFTSEHLVRQADGSLAKSDTSLYLDWVRPLLDHPNMDFFLIPDCIGGDVHENNKITIMVAQLEDMRAKAVPVFHLDDPIWYLESLIGRFPKGISIGSAGQWSTPGTQAWWKRIEEIMAVICDENGVPRCSRII